ncbi:MAG: hypothetical protein J0L86_00960 [Flavobacteriales bacterium]|nr:hypothetical protein [Flavobacteriales bacterium]
MENDTLQRESWWNRNWKWFVPTGCLTLLVIAGLVIGGIVYSVSSFMKNSDVYVHSLEMAQKNPEVTSKIGSPIVTDGIAQGNISINNDVGDANLTIPVKGSKGSGSIQVVAQKTGKEWEYQVMSFQSDDESSEPINLLEKSN